ncbi:hypothetical protein [Acrocarpospora sp. B8E8]|uniref:hypothetical protein n=1 Tax=Acrocarpospora sp. B8E8 TaxID=3153572 RepID=UPI00325F6657
MPPTIILGHAAERRLGRFPRAPTIGFSLYLAVRDDHVVGFLNLLISVEHNYALIACLGALPSAGSVTWKMLETAVLNRQLVRRDHHQGTAVARRTCNLAPTGGQSR